MRALLQQNRNSTVEKRIPYGRQWIDRDDIKEVVKVLRSDWITQGLKIKEFENALCKYTGAKYAVVVSSGTAALHIACLAAGIKSGDEVITSPITFVASANCILYCDGRPVFADIEKETGNINPKEIRSRITKRTKVLIPVHFAGHPVRLQEINKIAKRNGLIVIEDACHALGARYKGERIGNCRYSDITVFSFHPVKSITTGEGGAILTNKKEYYERFIMLRNHGIAKNGSRLIPRLRSGQAANSSHIHGSWYYEMRYLGFNYRITDLQCALGISQLRKINKFLTKRRKIAKIFRETFRGNPYFDIPIEQEFAYSSNHLYPIRLKDRYKNAKEKIFSKMRLEGLGVQVHYIPVYFHPYYKKLGYKKGICPNAEDFYRREISIPIFPAMDDEQIYWVVDKVRESFREAL